MTLPTPNPPDTNLYEHGVQNSGQYSNHIPILPSALLLFTSYGCALSTHNHIQQINLIIFVIKRFATQGISRFPRHSTTMHYSYHEYS